MAKITVVMAMAVLLLACKPDNKPTQTTAEQPLAQENLNSQAISTHPIIKNQAITFQRAVGNYPILLDTAYQTMNDDIAKLMNGLVDFDKQFDKDNIGGAHSLNYSVINHDDKLAILIDYGVSDMTSRYFRKYYQIDLKNKKQILLKEYLDNHQINKINEKLNQLLDNCRDDENKSEQCDDMTLYYFAFGGVDNSDIDILEHHTGFYVLDKDHIVIGFDSAKFTTSFKVNIRTYQISL